MSPATNFDPLDDGLRDESQGPERRETTHSDPRWLGATRDDLLGQRARQRSSGELEATTVMGLIILLFGWPAIVFYGVSQVYPKYLLKKRRSMVYRPRLRRSIEIIIALSSVGGLAVGLWSVI